MSWFSSKKKEEPKKKVTIDLNQLKVLLMKSTQYVQLDRQKQCSEGMNLEKQFHDMLRAPQRNRKDEEFKIIKIVRVLNTIEAYDKIVILVLQLENLIGQIVTCQGDAAKIPQIMPYIASICYYIERTNDLRGAVDIKQKMNEYFACDVATTFEKSVDPAAFPLFGPLNITSPSVQKYAADFSKKYSILDVPGLQYQPVQPPSQPSGGFPNQYPVPPQYNQGGQGQQGGYPNQQPYQPSIPSNNNAGYPQQQTNAYGQNNYSNHPANNQGQQIGGNPYDQLNRNAYNLYANNPNTYLPQIQQPNIGFQQNRDSNYNYPNPASIYNSKPVQPQQQSNNFNFVPLQPQGGIPQTYQPPIQQIPQQGPAHDPFAALTALQNIQKVELPQPVPFNQGGSQNVGQSANNQGLLGQQKQGGIEQSQQPIKPVNNSYVYNQNQQNLSGFQNPQGNNINQCQNNQPSNYPSDEIQQQQGYSQATFQVPGSTNNQQGTPSNKTGQFNDVASHKTQLTDPLADDQDVFETRIIGNDMEMSARIEQQIKPEQIMINHDLRSLEILHQYRDNKGLGKGQAIESLQMAVMDI